MPTKKKRGSRPWFSGAAADAADAPTGRRGDDPTPADGGEGGADGGDGGAATPAAVGPPLERMKMLVDGARCPLPVPPRADVEEGESPG